MKRVQCLMMAALALTLFAYTWTGGGADNRIVVR